MDLKINGICTGCNRYITNKKNHSVSNNINFQGKRAVKTLGYSLLAASMLTLSSCLNTKKSNPSEDIVRIVSKSEKTDSNCTTVGEYHYEDKHVVKSYHYFPTDDQINADNYSWLETIYPDGRVEKDSMGYKISITPEGERTVVYSETDESGNTTQTTIYPDSVKKVIVNYKTEEPDEVLIIETNYRPNGSMIERKYYNEYFVEDSVGGKEKKIEQSYFKYNDRDVMLMWQSNVVDSMRSENYNEYDKKGRLIYDDIKHEQYEYKGNSKYPFRSTSVYDDCKRIKLYNSDGSIEKEYFEASDGTITLASDSIM